VSREPVHRRDGDYFRSWHWFSRFVMAGRTVDGYREGMWDMARFRIRDIRNTLWPPGVSHLPKEGGDPATIGDVVTSERGSLSSCGGRVKSPTHVVDDGGGNTLGTAVDGAWNGWNQDLTTNDWLGNSGDQHEADMVGDIATEMTNDGIDRIDVVRYWHHWIGWQTDPNQESRYRLFSASDLAFVTLPSYSPELNPVEECWRQLQEALSNRFFNSLDELTTAIDSALDQLSIPKVGNYF